MAIVTKAVLMHVWTIIHIMTSDPGACQIVTVNSFKLSLCNGYLDCGEYEYL